MGTKKSAGGDKVKAWKKLSLSKETVKDLAVKDRSGRALKGGKEPVRLETPN